MTPTGARELLDDRPDHVGECDTCHRVPVDLWTDYTDPDEWARCVQCLREIARKERPR
jgi:hypothetical protein